MEECTYPKKTNTDLASVSILCLNDDCLLEIFNQLELTSQVRLAKLCPRLGYIFQLYCRRRCKVLKKDYLNDMTQREIQYFLSLTGGYVEEIINLPYKQHERNGFVNWVCDFCTNVRKINFSHTKITSKCLRKVLSNMRQVTSLELVNCSLDNKAMLGVAELSTLEYLTVEREKNITGLHLGKLKNLKELRLVECALDDKHLLEICQSSKELRKLDILWCNTLTDEFISSMPKYCLELETLKMWGTLQYAPLAQLPKLKSLEVSYDFADNYGLLFAELVRHKCESLQCLRIGSRKFRIYEYMDILTRLNQLKLLSLDRNKHLSPECLEKVCRLQHLETINLRYCNQINNDAVLALLKGCINLQYVNVMYCERITERLVCDVIPLLRVQLSRKKRMPCDMPILMLVYGTQINRSILEDPLYLAAAALLRLSFITPLQHTYENKYHLELPNHDELQYFY